MVWEDLDIVMGLALVRMVWEDLDIVMGLALAQMVWVALDMISSHIEQKKNIFVLLLNSK